MKTTVRRPGLWPLRPMLAVGMLFLAACGGGERPPVRVTNESSADCTDAEVIAVADEFAHWWGGNLEMLDGWEIVLSDWYVLCGDIDVKAVGCTDFRPRQIRVRVVWGYCIERTPLRHEVGHVVLAMLMGDPDSDHSHPNFSAPLWACR